MKRILNNNSSNSSLPPSADEKTYRIYKNEEGHYPIPEEELQEYYRRYDEIVAEGKKENAGTKGKLSRKEEKALLNRLRKYKKNFLWRASIRVTGLFVMP